MSIIVNQKRLSLQQAFAIRRQITMADNPINYNPVRHWNFRQVVNSCGGVNEAARILKKTNSNVSQYYVTPPKRSIGDRFAAQIEAAFGLTSQCCGIGGSRFF